jgi:hypothetical protein
MNEDCRPGTRERLKTVKRAADENTTHDTGDGREERRRGERRDERGGSANADTGF